MIEDDGISKKLNKLHQLIVTWISSSVGVQVSLNLVAMDKQATDNKSTIQYSHPWKYIDNAHLQSTFYPQKKKKKLKKLENWKS